MKRILLLSISLFFVSILYSQNLDWVKQIKSNLGSEGVSVATDAQGYVYTLGSFSDTAIFSSVSNNNVLVSSGRIDMYISKHDGSGNLIWVKHITGHPGTQFIALSMKLDGNANIIIVGSIFGTADFDPGAPVYELSGGGSGSLYGAIFILKLNSSGEFIWATNSIHGLVPGAYVNHDFIRFTIDNNNDIILSAEETGNGGGVFLAKYSSGGILLWETSLNSGNNSVATDSYNNIYVVGGGSLYVGTSGCLITKYNANGNFLFNKYIQNTGAVYSCTIDKFDNMLIAGFYNGTVDFNPSVNQDFFLTAINPSIFILKFDNQNNFKWVKNIYGTASSPYYTVNPRVNSIATDLNGNIFFTGNFFQTIDFDPANPQFLIQSKGFSDFYFEKLDSNGIFLWARAIGSASYDVANTIAVNNNNDVYLTGYYNDTTDFDPNAGVYILTNDIGPSYDAYILKISDSSRANGQILNSDTTICAGNSITLTASGNGTNTSITDIDGNSYPTVQICNQTWTAKNLEVSHYTNGDIIPQVTNPVQWTNLTTGAWCWYNNDSATYATTYGKLYNWFAISDPRGLVPIGWHVPNTNEWTILTDSLGGLNDAGGKMKEVGTLHWMSPNQGATNSSLFTALPGGFRGYQGNFNNINLQTLFWTSTESNQGITSGAWYRLLYNSIAAVGSAGNQEKYCGLSIRLLSNTTFSYLWSNGATTPNINVTPTQTTTYYCTISDGISSYLDSVTVYVKQPTTSNNNTSICSSQLPYLWNGVNYNTAGTYTWNGINATGCDSLATLILNIQPNVTPSFSITQSICSGDILTLPTTSLNGIIGNWSPALNNTATTTYTFTPNAGQCSSTFQQTVIVNQNSTISLSSASSTNVQTVCLNSAIANINYSIAGGGTGAVITGLPAGVIGVYNAGTRLFVISGSPSVAGTFNYTITTTGLCTNASLGGTITINAPSSLSLTPASNSNQTICINSPISPIVYNVGGSAIGATVSGLPNGVTGVFNNGVFTISGSSTVNGNFNFTITSTGPCNAVSLNGNLQITPLILPSFTQVPAICTGSNIILLTTSSNGITGIWSPVMNNTSTTTYTFTPDNGQCASITTMTVVVNSKTDPDFSNVPVICNGGIVPSLPTTSNNGITGSWSPSVINNTTAGTYTFTPSTNECANTKSINTVIIPNPYSNNKYTTVNAVQNQDYQLQARSFQNANYLWTPASGLSNVSIVNPLFNYNRQQQYNIKITTAEGCIIVDTILVRMYQNCEIYVPGGFSPNGDGMNDVLFPELVGIAQLKSFKVFDRWGQLMFQTNIPGQGWDGKYKGVKQPIETYMWMAEGIDVNGNIIKKNGSTILMR